MSASLHVYRSCFTVSGSYYVCNMKESGFCGFSVHYALVEQGIENIVVHAADIPTTGKERVLKTDAVDSAKIALALRRGELHGIYIKRKCFMDVFISA